jgi:hypothetical protein
MWAPSAGNMTSVPGYHCGVSTSTSSSLKRASTRRPTIAASQAGGEPKVGSPVDHSRTILAVGGGEREQERVVTWTQAVYSGVEGLVTLSVAITLLLSHPTGLASWLSLALDLPLSRQGLHVCCDPCKPLKSHTKWH